MFLARGATPGKNKGGDTTVLTADRPTPKTVMGGT